MAVYWYYLQNGNQAGPTSEATIRQMLANGQLSWGDFVWNETMPQWVAADQVPELAASKPVAPAMAVPPFEPPRSVQNQAVPPGPVGPASSGFEPAKPVGFPASPAPLPSTRMPETASLAFATGPEVSARTVEILTRTRTWVRLLGILTYLGAGLALLGGLVALVTAVRSGTGIGVGLVALLAYVVVAGLLAGFASLLSRYSSRITVVQTTRQGRSLEQALDAQRLLWKVIGVLAMIGVIINGLVLIVLLVTFASTWMSRSF